MIKQNKIRGSPSPREGLWGGYRPTVLKSKGRGHEACDTDDPTANKIQKGLDQTKPSNKKMRSKLSIILKLKKWDSNQKT